MTKISLRERSSLAHYGTDTSSREKLVKSAETLFAAKGYREVSVREIAAHAGVNSALVGYYFRGKQALFNEVYRSHAAPLARERMKRLADLTKGGRTPTVEEVLKAWLLPWMKMGKNRSESAFHLRLTANLSTERWEYTRKVASYMQRTHNEFIKVLQGSLTHLSKETLMWRLHFLTGAIAFGIRVPNPLIGLSKGKCDPNDLGATLSQILPYAIAGFCAPEVELNTVQL